MTTPHKVILFAAAIGIFVHCDADAQSLTNRLEKLRPELTHQYSVQIKEWRSSQSDSPNVADVNFDDSSWTNVSPGFSWSGDSSVWLRATVETPSAIAGQSVEALPLRLDLGVSGQCELYIDGQLKEAFQRECHYTLTEHAHAGQIFHLAIKSVIGPRNRQFNMARLYFNVLPELDQYIDEITFVELLKSHVSKEQRTTLNQALAASEKGIQFTDFAPEALESIRAQLTKARAELSPVSAITRKYDVYYIGHAHIDMNWQWTWPETIDVCHRTWSTAMNLMSEFPDFRFVQSQPGAYVPIETEYPDEFRRMQGAVASGQWDLVGGLWDESDTDIPSGEGLARSFLLGQSYFKSKFGKYAVTGWLPDSFGHAGQLPQIMQLSGIRNFYHMRCGNGMECTWWQSPDGSRVLKANTPSYDTKPQIEQLITPLENEERFGLPESVVIFGVGDHGGGPTREQIMRVQSFQQDPIFPRVHFIGADAFFDQLSKQPAAPSLPVVDTELQYTFEGCYTTHADAKLAIRKSENNLYSAEVLSSLASFVGQPYPADEFRNAWKPVTFMQFHDIAAGSAIHSTYDWMRKELAPAFEFEQNQIDSSLDVLTASTDAVGPGRTAVVVWNTLSFPRNDVVKVALTDALKYHSVQDAEGHHFPVQCIDEQTLVFIARDVPAFGRNVYFPSTDSCPSDGIKLNNTGAVCEIETPGMTLQINKSTGTISRLFSKSASWEVLTETNDANAFQLIGDTGSAWTMHLTGTNQILTGEGAKVSVLDDGPVFARVRVDHAFGKSTYTQDITVYGALPRVDIPTIVNWQEEHELLKIRLPLNAQNLTATAQNPYGSVARPVNGFECPGQKWMDVGETLPQRPEQATPVELSQWFNSSCTKDFDGDGNGYPAGQLPAHGRHILGSEFVPFNLPSSNSNQLDNITASGQQIPLPSGASGDTLYILGARARGLRGTDIGFQMPGGAIESRAFNLNHWKNNNLKNGSDDNEAGLTIPYQNSNPDRAANGPRIWIAQVSVPAGATGLVLPNDPAVHIFAITLATKPEPLARYGLSVLNNCKYGFDVISNVFRLTALRASDRPDPQPDQGIQKFTYSLYPHVSDWRAARTDKQALGLNIPLLARVARPHAATGKIPSFSVNNIGGQGDLIVSALKRSEDGNDFILRFYEADGQDTRARINVDRLVHAQKVDILERPLSEPSLPVTGNSVTLPVGHNQIVTLRLSFSPQ